MADAIHSVLTEKHGTKHGLYIWHMLNNIKSNMTSKLGLKYAEFHKDLVKCLNYCIDRNEFEEQWNRIVENDDYAKARSYLNILSQWRERWAPAYLKDYFFADMSSTQRGESMNKLLKGFLDSKIRLTEFLAAFERALDRCEEAEHIATYKKLVYPIRLTSQNSIENQAINYLTRYAWKKFAAEWNAKDAYACEEITNNNGVRHFKLSRYERPNIICWVYYNDCILTCCCRNLEFAGIICRHSLAVVLAKDYVNFYSHSQSQAPETPTSYESSSESVSQLRYMRIHRLSGEIASKIATNPDKCVDFMSYLKKYLETLYVDDAVSTSHENASASSKHPIINNPIKSKAVGRPKKGRIRCEKENTTAAAVKRKRGRPKANPEKSLTQNQNENTNLKQLRKRA
ncbi:5721_t:CDS:2, partial [Ambispora gerdemannii]